MGTKTKITEAYIKLFNREPKPEEKQWQLAKEIITKWDVRKIGEELALETLFEIINHTDFSTTEIARKTIGRAENLITEFLPEFSKHDPHMNVVEFLERQYYEKKKLKECNSENKII